VPKLSLDFADKLRDLRDRFGLQETEERYDERNFGDGWVILTAKDFSVRILRDRSQIFIDVAKPGEQWIDADKRFESLGIHTEPESVLSLEQFIDILAREKDRILQTM
jgi:hypothetical protein